MYSGSSASPITIAILLISPAHRSVSSRKDSLIASNAAMRRYPVEVILTRRMLYSAS
jgi:hypothetical protein